MIGTREDRGALIAGTLAGLSLASLHAALWGLLDDEAAARWPRWVHPRPVSYAIGTGVLLLASTGWAHWAGYGAAVRGIWLITVLGGAGDVAAYLVRAAHTGHGLAALARLNREARYATQSAHDPGHARAGAAGASGGRPGGSGGPPAYGE